MNIVHTNALKIKTIRDEIYEKFTDNTPISLVNNQKHSKKEAFLSSKKKFEAAFFQYIVGRLRETINRFGQVDFG